MTPYKIYLYFYQYFVSNQVLCVVAIVASLETVLGHGHGFSSQFIHRHDGPAQAVHVGGHDGHGHGHGHGHAIDYYVSGSCFK